MTLRIQKIFGEIESTQSFADVGCDHGYVAKMMLESGKCNNVTISDISEPSLNKAKRLLASEIRQGLVTAVCCDGLSGVDKNTQTVLIAGMGGEEIIKILTLSHFLPPTLVLQPMKNVDKVRRRLFELGYGIVKDYIFFDKKYYNLLVCKLGASVSPYEELEFMFGRDNLRNRGADFLNYLRKELALNQKYQKSVVSMCDLADVNKNITLLKEVLNGDL